MAMRRGVLAVAILAVLVSGAAGAGEDSTGAAYLTLPMSVRQMGMGDVSLGDDDVLRAWANPMMIHQDNQRGQISLGYGSLFGQMDNFGLGGGFQITRGFGLGLFFTRYAMSFEQVDSDGFNRGDDVERSFTSAGLGFGFRASWFRTGLMFKYVGDSVAGDDANTGAFDFGLGLVPIRGLIWSMAIGNVGAPFRTDQYSWGTGNSASEDQWLPLQFRNGIVYRNAATGLGGGLEYVTVKGMDDRFNLGLEWWIVKYVGIRLGSARVNLGNERQFTFGLSAQVKGIGLDYGLATHPLGTTQRVDLSYRFGSGHRWDEAPAPRREVKAEPAPAPAPSAAIEEPAPAPMTGAAPSPLPEGKRLNMAVADFEAQNVSAGDAAVIADMLRNALIKTSRFNIIEKKNMDKVLQEQAFQQTGCTSEDCAVKLGKLLNVQRITVGSFGKLMDKYFVTIRVINVEDGKIVFGESAKGRTVEDIERGIQVLAGQIAREAL